MKIKTPLMLVFLAAVSTLIGLGCKPKTTTQKVEDKVEDAQHEMHQGMERTGEKIKDATTK